VPESEAAGEPGFHPAFQEGDQGDQDFSHPPARLLAGLLNY
jgi:hypothetical protein